MSAIRAGTWRHTSKTEPEINTLPHHLSCVDPGRESRPSGTLRRRVLSGLFAALTAASIALPVSAADPDGLESFPVQHDVQSFAAVALKPAQDVRAQSVVLDIPYRSQTDGTRWAGSNCGPAALGMVLQKFGVDITNFAIREQANRFLGFADPDSGTRMEDLSRIAEQYGLKTIGLMDGKNYRKWNLDEVRDQLRAGNPVIPQLFYQYIPQHSASKVRTDHYVVLIGFEGDEFIFNDPSGGSATDGAQYRMTSAQLVRAWSASLAPMGAFAVGQSQPNPS